MLLNILIAILTSYYKELLLITQVCSNPTYKQREIFYSLPYTFIATNNYPRQDLVLGKKIGLWIEHYVDENSLSLNFQSFQL